MSFYGDMAERLAYCPYCYAEPGERCETSSGKPCEAHVARWSPLQQAYAEGYDEAVKDTQRDPEGWMRYCDVWIDTAHDF